MLITILLRTLEVLFFAILWIFCFAIFAQFMVIYVTDGKSHWWKFPLYMALMIPIVLIAIFGLLVGSLLIAAQIPLKELFS